MVDKQIVIESDSFMEEAINFWMLGPLGVEMKPLPRSVIVRGAVTRSLNTLRSAISNNGPVKDPAVIKAFLYTRPAYPLDKDGGFMTWKAGMPMLPAKRAVVKFTDSMHEEIASWGKSVFGFTDSQKRKISFLSNLFFRHGMQLLIHKDADESTAFFRDYAALEAKAGMARGRRW
jgi:hypothetical protein